MYSQPSKRMLNAEYICVHRRMYICVYRRMLKYSKYVIRRVYILDLEDTLYSEYIWGLGYALFRDICQSIWEYICESRVYMSEYICHSDIVYMSEYICVYEYICQSIYVCMSRCLNKTNMYQHKTYPSLYICVFTLMYESCLSCMSQTSYETHVTRHILVYIRVSYVYVHI